MSESVSGPQLREAVLAARNQLRAAEETLKAVQASPWRPGDAIHNRSRTIEAAAASVRVRQWREFVEQLEGSAVFLGVHLPRR